MHSYQLHAKCSAEEDNCKHRMASHKRCMLLTLDTNSRPVCLLLGNRMPFIGTTANCHGARLEVCGIWNSDEFHHCWIQSSRNFMYMSLGIVISLSFHTQSLMSIVGNHSFDIIPGTSDLYLSWLIIFCYGSLVLYPLQKPEYIVSLASCLMHGKLVDCMAWGPTFDRWFPVEESRNESNTA